MDLKNFKVLDKSQYDALSEREQVKYELQLEAYKAEESKKLAEDAAKSALESYKSELETSQAEAISKMQEANEAKLKEFADKHSLQMDEMQKALNRAKIGEVNERMKGFSDLIIEKLSTQEGEEMIKSFFNGQREKFNVEFKSDNLKAMTMPTGGGVAPVFAPIVGPGNDDFHARNVIPVVPTTTDLVKFIQYVVDEEADGFGVVGVGGQKPSLNYIGEAQEAPVRKIAGLLDVPDELLDDVVGFRSWIALELPKAYLDFEDYQIFKGDGLGVNLLGLWEQASSQSLPFGGVSVSSNVIDKIMAGITEVRKQRRPASAVFVSPVAWMEIFINKGNTDEYTYPFILDANGVLRIGGVAIFWSNVFNDGEGLVGDFARGTAIWQRREMTMGYFNQNKDNVEKNIVTIRLEGRIALPIYYPDGFLKLTLSTPTT